MSLQATIEKAMLEQAPALHRELKATGKLAAHVRELADQVHSSTVQMVQEQRLADKWDRLPPMELAGRMRAAAAAAGEVALAEALQFPQDETSPPSRAATTA